MKANPSTIVEGIAQDKMALLENASICRFEDWSNWRRQHYQHDEAGNMLRCQVCGAGVPNVKQGAKVVAQGFTGGCVFELNGFVYVAVNVGARESTRYQQIAQLFKFLFGFVRGHGPKATPLFPNGNGGKAVAA